MRLSKRQSVMSADNNINDGPDDPINQLSKALNFRMHDPKTFMNTFNSKRQGDAFKILQETSNGSTDEYHTNSNIDN